MIKSTFLLILFVPVFVWAQNIDSLKNIAKNGNTVEKREGETSEILANLHNRPSVYNGRMEISLSNGNGTEIFIEVVIV